MTVIGIIWLSVLTLVSGVAVRGLLQNAAAREGGSKGGFMAVLWFLLTLALLVTHLPSGIDPFRAAGLHLGATALIGFILHVLTRGSADRVARSHAPGDHGVGSNLKGRRRRRGGRHAPPPRAPCRVPHSDAPARALTPPGTPAGSG